MAAEPRIKKPKRWDIPFSDDMTDTLVEQVALQQPFCNLDTSKLRGSVSLEGILKNDARFLKCEPGDILIREGDWGNSAFFLLSGSVSVEVTAGKSDIPAELIGRADIRRKSFLEIVKQFWNSKQPEIRDLDSLSKRDSASARGIGRDSRIYLQDFPTIIDKLKTTQIKAIELFGEQSALGRIERTATVIADTNCELLEVRWQGLRDLMRDEALRERIDERFRAYGLRAFLRNSNFFQHLYDDDDLLTPNERIRFAAARRRLKKETEFTSFGDYDKPEKFRKAAEFGTANSLENESVIAREGDYPNGVILIRSGVARVSHKHHNGHRTTGYLTPGQAFGVNEIIRGAKANQPLALERSLRAIGYVTVVIVPTALFEELVLKEAVDEFLESELSYQSVQADDATIDAGFREFLVERRIVNGTATMVIDLDRCTRCDDCVRACATAHDNNPRFVRNGPVHGKHMIANACMHCVDPTCMIQCPTGAIHRNVMGGQVVINDPACIGCGLCSQNCGYDAIRLVPIRDSNGQPIRDENKHEPIFKATKCDLCADQLTGPACQEACPHDALIRMDFGEKTTVAEWLGQ